MRPFSWREGGKNKNGVRIWVRWGLKTCPCTTRTSQSRAQKKNGATWGHKKTDSFFFVSPSDASFFRAPHSIPQTYPQSYSSCGYRKMALFWTRSNVKVSENDFGQWTLRNRSNGNWFKHFLCSQLKFRTLVSGNPETTKSKKLMPSLCFKTMQSRLRQNEIVVQRIGLFFTFFSGKNEFFSILLLDRKD